MRRPVDVALRNPKPWVWIIAGLVVLAFIIVPLLVVLIGSGVVVMDHVSRMSAAGLFVIGLVIVTGLAMLAALLWPESSASERAGRKTG